MPTEFEYRAAAERFAALGRTHADTVAWAPPQPSTAFTGPGPVGDQVDHAISRTLDQLVRASIAFERLAHECRRRADVCRAYRQTVDRYRDLPADERSLVAAPVRPAWWAEL